MADSQRKTANVLPPPSQEQSGTLNGITYYVHADGSVDLSGIAEANVTITIDLSSEFTIPVSASQGCGGTIALNNSFINASSITLLYNATVIDSWGFSTPNRTSTSYSAMANKTINRYSIGIVSGTNLSSGGKIGLAFSNNGTPVTPYQPYWQHSLRKLGTSTDTLTTLPADLYADGNNATVGLVGNMSQSGTPTPQNPIQPSETGERTGNLCDSNPYKTGYAINAYGTETQNSEFNIYTAKVSAETQYRLSFVYPESAQFRMVRIHEYSDGIWQSQLIAQNCNLFPLSFTTSANINEVRISIVNTTSKHMINTGSTTLPYEPYGYKIPILNNSITTNVYLGEVQTTRKIKKLVLDGTEDGWREGTGFFYNQQISPDYKRSANKITLMCTHYQPYKQVAQGGDVPNGHCSFYYDPAFQRLYFVDNNINTLADWKAYLAQQYAAGTPVTVWYVLATEETGIVNEPIRKIGDYADTVSGITIPTITGKDTFDVLTTLKPSEVSLAYTGWHDATVEEWDGSEWQ